MSISTHSHHLFILIVILTTFTIILILLLIIIIVTSRRYLSRQSRRSLLGSGLVAGPQKHSDDMVSPCRLLAIRTNGLS